jgi:hypothetical protein
VDLRTVDKHSIGMLFLIKISRTRGEQGVPNRDEQIRCSSPWWFRAYTPVGTVRNARADAGKSTGPDKITSPFTHQRLHYSFITDEEGTRISEAQSNALYSATARDLLGSMSKLDPVKFACLSTSDVLDSKVESTKSLRVSLSKSLRVRLAKSFRISVSAY